MLSGTPAFFLRLQGCSVRCFFCDEKQTWQHQNEVITELDAENLLAQFKQVNPRLKRLVITGGEPTEHSLYNFIKTFTEEDFLVSVESAGTGAYLVDLFMDYKNPIWLTLSPKEPYSDKGCIRNEEVWQRCSELKFVLANEDAEKYLINTIIPKIQNRLNPCPIFLVPDWFNFEESKVRVLDLCKLYPTLLRFGVQTHKFLNIP